MFACFSSFPTHINMSLVTLAICAFQNSFKSLFMRFVMEDHPDFLLSTAVITVEMLKAMICLLYILLVEKNSIRSIHAFLRQEHASSILLIVPAASYIFQMSMEYVAYANLDPNTCLVLVQTKMLATAFFFVLVLKKKLCKKQMFSLILLTVGVMICSLKDEPSDANQARVTADEEGSSRSTSTPKMNRMKGILATLGIALSSGFASVYTEKVIKKQDHAMNNKSDTLNLSQNHLDMMKSHKRDEDAFDTEMISLNTSDDEMKPLHYMQQNPHHSSGYSSYPAHQPQQQVKYSLAYTQIQLALVSLIILGAYDIVIDLHSIRTKGFFYHYDRNAFLISLTSAVGGLVVAGVLKYADSILKGYATAVSVILTGILSKVMFGTELSLLYWLGLVNVICAIFLYSATGLDEYIC